VREQALSCLEAIASRAEASGSLDRRSAREALDFLRSFADRCHHGKEEQRLFPLLEARGMPRSGGPTGVLSDEHQLGRKLLLEMAEAIERNALADFALPARWYVELMRAHIAKEDLRLFPMAEQLLSTADDEQLLTSFETAERTEMGQGTHEHYLALAHRLAERLAVPRAAACAACGCAGQPSNGSIQAGR
jgi:hemerythrin-like domain-containing protein